MEHDGVELLGRGDLARLPNPASPTAALRARWTRALVQAGVTAYVANVSADAVAVVAGGETWPALIGEAGHDACVTSSPYAWYARYVAEQERRRSAAAALAQRARTLPTAALLRSGGVDRCVHLNNWAVAAGPPGEWSRETLAKLTARLVERHPRHAVLVRSVVPALDREGAAALRDTGYRFVRSRAVYLLDTRDGAYLRRNNVQIDLGKLDKTRCEVVSDASRLLPHAGRMAEMYRALYVDKHVALNAQLTPRFFACAIGERLLEMRALFDDGRMRGFVGMIVSGAAVYASTIGYDIGAPRREGLYRLLVALFVREAAARGAILNLGSGAARFKELRGAHAADEYDAVYDAHLPLRRRLPWMWLEAATRRAPRRDHDAGSRPANHV